MRVVESMIVNITTYMASMRPTQEAESRSIVSEQPGVALSARMFGSLVVTLNGIVVDTLSSRRTRQVLAYLLLHRRAAVPRDVLMDTFWPTASPEAARNNLHVALSAVRQVLRVASPVSVLQRRHDTYRLSADSTWVDVEDFGSQCASGRRADRAGDAATAVRCYSAADRLYQGCLLADDPYSGWVTTEREGLKLEVLHAHRRLAESYTASGDPDSAVLVARRALSIDPYDEAFHRQLMLAFRDLGQLHLALGQYQRCAELLWQAFQIRPSAQTVHLNEQLRRRQPVLAVSRALVDGYMAWRGGIKPS
jgi:DNA-binding SARP family transcriptional activator